MTVQDLAGNGLDIPQPKDIQNKCLNNLGTPLRKELFAFCCNTVRSDGLCQLHLRIMNLHYAPEKRERRFLIVL
jgi:hypothetical protein